MTLCFVGTFLIKLISFTPFHIFVKIPKLAKVHQQSHIFSLVRNKTTPEARKKKQEKQDKVNDVESITSYNSL